MSEFDVLIIGFSSAEETSVVGEKKRERCSSRN
jgi:hypothetical protein